MDHFAHRMRESAKSNHSRTIFSADCTPAQAKHLLQNSRRKFVAVKVHPETAASWAMTDEAAIRYLKMAAREGEHHDIPVLLDLKLADVPHINAWKTKLHLKKGYDAITCHCFMGEASVKAALDSAKNFGKGVFPIVSTSSEGNFFSESQVTRFTSICTRLDVSGILSGGNNPNVLAQVRQMFGDQRLILSPGIGPQGGDEQKALQHANYIIVGRRLFAENKQE